MNKQGALTTSIVTIVLLAALFGGLATVAYQEFVPNPTPGQDAGGDHPDAEVPGDGNSCFLSVGTGCDEPDPDPIDPTPVGTSDDFETFLAAHVNYFGNGDGSYISNKNTVCTNACIGCGEDVSSESEARIFDVFVDVRDKANADQVHDYVVTTMLHPEYDWMMWKLEGDGASSSCGGYKSAVDSELIMIDALLDAHELWVEDDQNRRYEDTAQRLMDSLHAGLIDGNYLPYCIQPSGSGSEPCVREVYLGYVPLNTLERMCTRDNKWCSVYNNHVQLSKAAVQSGGMYGAYIVDEDRFVWKEAWIHTNWALKHCATNDDCRPSVQSLIDQNTALYEIDRKLCQEYQPGQGCKESNPPYDVYGHWAEIYAAIGDGDMTQNMLDEIHERWLYAPDGVEHPLIHKDHFTSVSLLQGIVAGEQAGGAFA